MSNENSVKLNKRAYTFTGQAFGYILATSKADALAKLKEGLYEDIIDLDSVEEESIKEEPDLD